MPHGAAIQSSIMTLRVKVTLRNCSEMSLQTCSMTKEATPMTVTCVFEGSGASRDLQALLECYGIYKQKTKLHYRGAFG